VSDQVKCNFSRQLFQRSPRRLRCQLQPLVLGKLIIRNWPFPGYYRRYLFLFQWLQATFGFFARAVARTKDVLVAKEFPKWNSAFANESRSETGVSAIMLFTSSLLCVITSFFAK